MRSRVMKAFAAPALLALGLGGFAGAASADPSDGRIPDIATHPIVGEATTWPGHVDVSVEVVVGKDLSSHGVVGYGVPPGPFCDGGLEETCGPIGPVGRLVRDTVVRVDSSELVNLSRVDEPSAQLRGGAGGGAVGYGIPPGPVCNGGSCGPIGPVGDQIREVLDLADRALTNWLVVLDRNLPIAINGDREDPRPTVSVQVEAF